MAFYVTSDDVVHGYTNVKGGIKLDSGQYVPERELDASKLFSMREAAEMCVKGYKWDVHKREYVRKEEP